MMFLCFGQYKYFGVIIDQMLPRLGSIVSSNVLPCLPFLFIIFSIVNDMFFSTPSTEMPLDLQPNINLFQNCLISSSSYCIRSIRSADQLQIELLDYKNFAIYKRIYRASDIGGQINRRVGLDDIANMLQYAKQSARFQHDFGQILTSNKGEQLIMIEGQGIVNVFVEVSTISRRETVRSQLNLFLIRTMKDPQRFEVKLNIQQKLIASLYEPRLLKLEQDNRNLYQRINQLERKCQISKCPVSKQFFPGSMCTSPEVPLGRMMKQRSGEHRKPNENNIHIKL